MAIYLVILFIEQDNFKAIRYTKFNFMDDVMDTIKEIQRRIFGLSSITKVTELNLKKYRLNLNVQNLNIVTTCLNYYGINSQYKITDRYPFSSKIKYIELDQNSVEVLCRTPVVPKRLILLILHESFINTKKVVGYLISEGTIIADIYKTQGNGECAQNAVVYDYKEIINDDTALLWALKIRSQMADIAKSEFYKLSSDEQSLVLRDKNVTNIDDYIKKLRSLGEGTGTTGFDTRLMCEIINKPVWYIRLGIISHNAELFRCGLSKSGVPSVIFNDQKGHASYIKFRTGFTPQNLLELKWGLELIPQYINYFKISARDLLSRRGIEVANTAFSFASTLDAFEEFLYSQTPKTFPRQESSFEPKVAKIKSM